MWGKVGWPWINIQGSERSFLATMCSELPFMRLSAVRRTGSPARCCSGCGTAASVLVQPLAPAKTADCFEKNLYSWCIMYKELLNCKKHQCDLSWNKQWDKQKRARQLCGSQSKFWFISKQEIIFANFQSLDKPTSTTALLWICIEWTNTLTCKLKKQKIVESNRPWKNNIYVK